MALSVALKRPELFIGLVLSSSMVDIDPASAGAFTVSGHHYVKLTLTYTYIYMHTRLTRCPSSLLYIG